MKKREVAPTTTYRGTLFIAGLEIPVHGFIKNKKESLPTASRVSTLVDVVSDIKR
jgi:hypothetical protein